MTMFMSFLNLSFSTSLCAPKICFFFIQKPLVSFIPGCASINGIGMLDSSSITNSRYTYTHDRKWSCGAVDTHHIVVRKSGVKSFFVYFFALLILASASYFCLIKGNSITIVFWSFLLDAFLVKLLLRKPIEKESVVVMPAFGVQLETHYARWLTLARIEKDGGRVSKNPTRSRLSFQKAKSKAVKHLIDIFECVTPVTCYWKLCLIVRGETELKSVFKEIHPPAKMLVPIWKALCAATGNEESLDASTEDGQ